MNVRQGRLVNVLLSTLPGLGVAPTLTVVGHCDDRECDIVWRIFSRLPKSLDCTRLLISTNAGKYLTSTNTLPLSSLLESSNDAFLPLRLSVRCLGGKGGFGSQLRAAGGRMSSRKKKRNHVDENASSRNLDGRRLRTISEAKAFAEYLVAKPELDRQQQQRRIQKLQSFIETTERKRNEIINTSNHRVTGQWVESKERAIEDLRESLLKVPVKPDSTGRDCGLAESSLRVPQPISQVVCTSEVSRPVKVYGWDDDDDDDGGGETESENPQIPILSSSR